jgi:hypothetical protein
LYKTASKEAVFCFISRVPDYQITFVSICSFLPFKIIFANNLPIISKWVEMYCYSILQLFLIIIDMIP